MSEIRTNNQTDTDKDYDLKQRLSRLTKLARAQLFWERYAPVLALGVAFAAGFLILTFAGVWQYLGDPWRFIALIIALAVLIRAAWRAQTIALPSAKDARRRVELDSGLKHRPLDKITDRPALGKLDAVWDQHMQSVRQMATRAERPIWRAVLAPLDRYYLRFILPVLLGGALILGLGDNRERMRHAIFPGWQHGMSSGNVNFEAWIDPPDYTGRPPIYFRASQSVDIPEGSKLVTRVNGLKTAPRLKLALKNKTRYIAPNRLGPRLFETRNIIKRSGRAEYRLGTKRQVWRLTAIPDTPPVLSIDEPPMADKRDRLVVTYSLRDDYGVENLELVMSRLDGRPGETAVTLPIAARQRRADKAKLSVDLTKHIWAGRKVSGYLRGVDGYGHVAVSEPAFFTIPDKIFVEPLAKAIIENRQLLIEAQKQDYKTPAALTRNDIKNFPVFDQYQPRFRLERAAPEAQRAVELLSVITDQPEGYYEDPALFMGLNFIRAQIQYADENSDIDGLPEELWKIALRAEFGTLGTALEEMREAERALREAISRRAPQREIDTLFDRYNGAVDNFLEELRRKALENPSEEQGGGEGGEGTNQDEIQELLKAIEEANRIGDVDGARRALARLAELLENLEIQLSPNGGGGGDGPPQEGELSEEEQEALEDLAELLGEQRELQSETERAESESLANQGQGQQENQDGQESQNQQGQNQQNQGGGQGQENRERGIDSPQALSQRQQGLSERLAELQEQLETLLSERGAEGEESGETGGASEDENSGEAGGGTNEDEESGEAGGASDESLEDSLERALGAMRESGDSLSASELRESLAQMAQAIEALRQAGDQLAEQASGQGQGEDGSEDGEGQSAENESDDPFGREEGVNGGLDTETEVDLEDRNRQKRARELLEELRNRAAEEEREQLEKDYLERLLKQF